MPTEIITKDDLREFKEELIQDLKSLLFTAGKPDQKDWLRSSEVMKMLGIKATSLQTLRITRQLPYTKLGGTLYYERKDVEKALRANKRDSSK